MSVRWGFLGAGGISTALAPVVHRLDGATLAAVASRDDNRSARLEPERVLPSYEALVEDEQVDAVYIGLQNDVHLEWTLRALQAGKHVLCEKPMGMSAREVEQMAATAGELVCAEASWYRWHPRTRRIEALIAAGALGEIRHVTCRFTTRADFLGNYRREPAHGGGAVYDIGHYALSAALIGFPGAVPDDVQASLRRWDTGADLAADCRLRFGEADARVEVSFDDEPQQSWELAGTLAAAAVPQRAFNPPADEPTELFLDGSVERWAPVNAYATMFEAVSRRCAGEGEAWVLPLSESRRTALVIDAVLAAGEAG